ncbi:MAG: FAD-binding dehydrogenase [Pseudomonas sp.]|nr:FAD-binding dehydrogenase [Pseudomonas sp.]
MGDMTYQAETLVIGAGLAGICTALELLNNGRSVLLIDACDQQRFGGQAKEAFGGMLLSHTPEQRRNHVTDSSELFWRDWQQAAQFQPDNQWAQRWAMAYCEHNRSEVYDWLHSYDIRFFPVVQWVERGHYGDGNSVPRYHVAWGCGQGIIRNLLQQLLQHPKANLLRCLFLHKVSAIDYCNGRVVGCHGVQPDGAFSIQADNTVICSGGINGNLEKVRQHWDPIYGPAPDNLLTGTHPSADGSLHDCVENIGGQVRNLHYMWNYAAGIAHPKPEYPQHGLSLIPPRSALWMDCYGRRIGPQPMVTGFDTHDLCKTTGRLPQQYTWQVMNKRIADKELAISGSDSNPHFRDKKLLKIILQALRGNAQQTQWLIEHCPDVASGNTLAELIVDMQRVAPESLLDSAGMQADIARYDAMLRGPQGLHNDDQIRRIQQLRQWRGDRPRTCNLQPILDSKQLPLIAIRLRLISRKSMGGMLTDLGSRVLNEQGSPISGLYAAGEAAGFGGAGISGVRSLEGTFLSNCIFNGRRAARSIIDG